MNRTEIGMPPLVGAAVLPAAVVSVYCYRVSPNGSEILTVFLITLLVALLHVVLLGVPGLAFLRRKNWDKAISVLLLGFIAGGLPIAIFSWWLLHEQSRSIANSSGAFTVNDFVPTGLNYSLEVLLFGILGVVGALGYWLTETIMRSNNRSSGRDAL